jgi:hypothetical protein
MGGVWIAIEHTFGLILQQWTFLYVFWKHKILGNVYGLLYCIAMLLTNSHMCIIANQTSVYYRCPHPSLHEYFHE